MITEIVASSKSPDQVHLSLEVHQKIIVIKKMHKITIMKNEKRVTQSRKSFGNRTQDYVKIV